VHKTPQQALEIIREHVCYAKSLGLKVRYTPEDATRTEFEFLVQICNAAIEAGADRISFADTLGIMQPHSMFEQVSALREALLPCKIDLHCHDDYGLALANAMAGIRAGAKCIHTTVNGLGERTGIPDLAETILSFHNLEGIQKYNIQPLMELSSYLEKISGFFFRQTNPSRDKMPSAIKAESTPTAFSKTQEPMNPSTQPCLGRESKIIIDKYTGKSAVASRLEEYGIEVSGAELEVIVSRIKNIGDERKQLFDADIFEIAEQVTGREIDVIPRDISAMLMVEVESHVYTSSVVRRLRGLTNVNSVYEVTGDYDISAFINAENIMALNNLIEEVRTVQGVKRTDTRMVLKKYNGSSK
jgi:2-isopropylmalate synthase